MFALTLALIAMSPTADAARIKVVAVTASSTFPEQEGVRYEARQATDGKQGSSWVEGEDGSGLGSWVELDLGGEKQVKRIKIWGGLWYSYEYFQRANRPKQVEIKFSDGTTETLMLSDEMEPQELVLSAAKTTSTVRIKIKAIHNGNTWSDTAISEIQVFDAAEDTAAPIKSFTASSELPADDDGSYVAKNMGDGITDSMWCEGNKTSDGTAEWVEFNFDGSHSVSQLEVINGIGSSMGLYMKANRFTAATLQFSDGSTESVTFKPVMFMAQKISFPAHTTTKVRMTFDTVVAGKEYNDLCITEAYFRK